jgi:iron(III) transport system substrate-binding protein
MKSKIKILFLVSLFLMGPSCTKGTKPTIWIYTSIYKEVIEEIKKPLQAKFTNANIEFFQGGSEIIANKVAAELSSGNVKANLILTSDPFWYRELKNTGHLLAYESPMLGKTHAAYSDPQFAWTVVRLPMMVIGYNPESLEGQAPPDSYQALLSDPKYKGKASIGSPLESGTHFTFFSVMFIKQSEKFFETLKANQWLSQGGNSSVLSRIESKERPFGILLLENVLTAQKKGSPIKYVFPKDGTIPIPSPIGILKYGPPETIEMSKKIYDWFFTPEAQKSFVDSGMYSALSDFESPTGTPPWKSLEPQLANWSSTLEEMVIKNREALKKSYAQTFLNGNSKSNP